MATNDFTDLSGGIINKVSIDNHARLVAITLYKCETGHFDGAGTWIEYETPLYEEKYELLFSDVLSHMNLETIENEILGTISLNETERIYTMTTNTTKQATIRAEQLDITKHLS